MAFDTKAGIFMHLFSVGASILGFVLLIVLFSRNPIKLVQKSQNDLFKINIIYTSFNKQMAHLDASFKKLLSAPEVAYDQLKQCATQTRSVVDKTLEVLYTSTEDLLD